jgi:hypothetical protein
MEKMSDFIEFLNRLEEKKIYYKLNKIRDESILVNVVVPGQRWEIEFMNDGSIEIEKFISNGKIYNENEISILFKNFSD